MPRNSRLTNTVPQVKDAYISSDDKDAQRTFAKAIEAVRPVDRSSAGLLSDTLPDITVREGLSRTDYELWRPGERVPIDWPSVMDFANRAYERVSIIKDIVDLMSDFTCQGARLVHPYPQVEQFYRNWWERVNGSERSERFANIFYRIGNVAIKKRLGKFPQRVIDELQQGIMSATAAIPDEYQDYSLEEVFDTYDEDIQSVPKVPKYVLPSRYEFIDPQVMVLLGGELALFTGQRQYAVKLSPKIINIIRNPSTPDHRDMIGAIPGYIVKIVKNGGNKIKLDPSRLSVFHYKKDDWQTWALPITYCVMDDIIMLQKMKMADLVALDGCISHIRIWKLGNLEAKMLPTDAAINKLSEILALAGNGQNFDLIWGPDIDIKETSTDIHQFLGSNKYEPTLHSIYAGLGVPPTLTAAGGSSGGFTNNALSLKTLIERLNYGRAALTRFWNQEIKWVQRAMGFRFPAKIEFKNISFNDESAQNQLLINLLDRDIISMERVRENFGYIPEIEEAAIRSEYKARKSDKVPAKASPFHDAHPDLTLKKIFAQTGAVTPSEVGIELDEKNPQQKSGLDLQQEALKVQKQAALTKKKQISDPANDVKGQPGQGRPPGSKDQNGRKPREVRPRSGASEFMNTQLWAKDAQQKIGEIINPVFLKQCNKKNMRSLTATEIEDVEYLKWSILCNIDPYTKIDKKLIAKMMQEPLKIDNQSNNFWKFLVNSFIQTRGSQPTIEDIRQIQNYAYALSKGI